VNCGCPVLRQTGGIKISLVGAREKLEGGSRQVSL